ncbi:E3 ubiquitin-ligase [Micractinium conductrix]|uniref:E3 ubiquitin-ligase n=1 Tax=Micractinium conductrix TaxID=554055 RepID=A0A2P6V7N2_9CHLO|nr:E3 ubiquitin-ligase [Micractinium conductrix]|eukprot:PSC70096.1 E3 ubiquitin-ligase [Micractinium conductrix]
MPRPVGVDRPFFSAANLLERKRLGEFLDELAKLQGPLAGPAKPPELIKFSTAQSVGEAMKVLAAYNILSAPVSDAVTGEYVGMLDVADVMGGVVRGVYPELLEKGFLEQHKRLSISELQSVGVEFNSRKLSNLLHGGDLWFKGDTESNLLEVVETGFRVRTPPKLHAPHHHLRVHHRIAVFDILPGEQTPDGPVPEWHITDIISQTDVLRFLAAHIDRLDPAFSLPLSKLGLVTNDVHTVTAGTPTLAAFALMHRKGLSGVGVTAEPGGPLVANLSMSDLRGLTPERFGALALPVGSFLLLQKGLGLRWEDCLTDQLPAAVKEGRWAEALAAIPLVAVGAEMPFKDAIAQLVDHNKHRVWIVDEAGKGIGVLTPTDALRLVVSASLDLFGCEDSGARLEELLDSLHCRHVMERLIQANFSENAAVRACLEVHQAKRGEVTCNSALKWIRRHDLRQISQPLSPLELLGYLSQVVVGLVEGLPFADALLQRQITVGFASSGSSGGRAGESGVGGSSTLLAGGGATVEAGQQQLWQTVLVDAAQGSTVATLQSALQQVAANQAAVGNNISSGDASEDAVPVGAGSLSAPGAGASSPGAAPPGFQPPAETTEQQQQRQQQQQPHQQAGPSTGEATGEGFGTSVWSRAMQTLAGLRRTASGAARVAPVEEPAAAAAGEAHQEQGEDQHEAEQRQLSEPQLESLRSVAGPGVEVLTAEQHEGAHGATFHALPSINLEALPGAQAAGVPARAAAAGGGAAAGKGEAPAASAGESARQEREEAAGFAAEAQVLRLEREDLRARLQETEHAAQRSREEAQREAQQRREREQQAAAAAVELKASQLREQEAAAQAADLGKQLAAERRRREGAENRVKRASAEAAGAATAAAAAAHQRELEVVQQQLRSQRQQAARAAERAGAEAAAAQAELAAAGRRREAALQAEKAALAAALAEATEQARRVQLDAEAERAALQGQLHRTQERVQAAEAAAQELQQQLAAARDRLAAAEAATAVASADAEAAQQRVAELLAVQAVHPQQRGSVPISPHPLAAQPAPAAPTPSRPSLLFGSGHGMWTVGGGGLFGSTGKLDGLAPGSLGPLSTSPAAAGPAVAGRPHASLLYGSGGSSAPTFQGRGNTSKQPNPDAHSHSHARKREFDRHDASGRAHETEKKHGEGAGNWGPLGAEQEEELAVQASLAREADLAAAQPEFVGEADAGEAEGMTLDAYEAQQAVQRGGGAEQRKA